MKVDLPVDSHKAVGPVPDMYGHGPVTIIQDSEVGDPDSNEGVTLFVCQDCGYVTTDNRRLDSAACLRSSNTISTSWREYLEADEYPK
jgi:predicted metal-binding protein